MTASTNGRKDSLRVCALVPYPPDTTPSQRFRVEQWTSYLAEDGIQVDLVPYADADLLDLLRQPGRHAAKAAANGVAFLRSALRLPAARHYDAVLIHRAICMAGPALLERLLKLFNRPVIFDFDDAIYMLHTSEANRHFGWLKFPGKTSSICELSDHVVVGNDYLADYARQFNRRVSVVPTSVDTDHHTFVEKNGGGGRVVVGWTGSSTSQTHLELFVPVLREIQANRDVEIRVVSNREPVLPGVDYVWRPWAPETEVEEIGRIDVGIMPMPDDVWAKGKCALKALQYMAMGIPTVASAVGTNCDVIQHGENGLLATTDEDWVANVTRLVDDPALRARLGRAGFETVQSSYSMRRCAAMFADVVRQTVESHRR